MMMNDKPQWDVIYDTLIPSGRDGSAVDLRELTNYIDHLYDKINELENYIDHLYDKINELEKRLNDD
jgi:hypothetical protein